MPLLFSQTRRWLSDLKAGEACQKQAEAVPEKPATSRLFNACNKWTPTSAPFEKISKCRFKNCTNWTEILPAVYPAPGTTWALASSFDRELDMFFDWAELRGSRDHT